MCSGCRARTEFLDEHDTQDCARRVDRPGRRFMKACDLDLAREAIGRSERALDVVTPRLITSLQAVVTDRLDGTAKSSVPISIHWCLAPTIACMKDIGPDGHPALGTFMPYLPLQRRMWVGSSVAFHDALHSGDEVERVSRITDITAKHGRSGSMCFVTVEHELTTARGLAISERQTVVYRGAPTLQDSAVTSEARPLGHWHRSLVTDGVLLFRYSALTFNAHRIHYDRDYSRESEGYRGLVVHGPLQASYLLEYATGIYGRAPTRFDFRAVQPAFEGEQLTLNADSEDNRLRLWVADLHGRPTVQASADW